jgi:glycolate oxidase
MNKEAVAMKNWNYNPVTGEIVATLEKICGPEAVISGNAKQLEKYSHDAVAEKQYAHAPEVVVSPSTTDQIAAIMRLANELRVPMTPRAAGSPAAPSPFMAASFSAWSA